MRSRFSIYGHPLHPVLVALPIGLLAWSFVSLLVFMGSDDNETWYDISYYSAIAGVATALVSALPGFGDLLTIAIKNERTKPLALVHMVLNLGVVVLYVIIAALMYDERAFDGGRLGAVLALQLVAMSMLGAAGWLGGEMVFRHHLGVVPEAEQTVQAQTARDRSLRPQIRGR